MQHKQIQLTEGNIHYWVEGKDRAPLIIFTHGATASHTMFSEQVEFFRRDYRVVVWDMPAHGMSCPFSRFSLSVCTEGLLKIIDLESHSGNAHLVGQSAGGYAAQLAAIDAPEKVISLAMIGSTPVGGEMISKIDRALLMMTPFLLKLYPSEYLKDIIAKSVSCTDHARADMRESLNALSKQEIAGIMDGVYKGVLSARDPQFKCPLLITFGEFDRTGKVAAYSRRWAEQTFSPLVVIPAASHNANLDNPGFFNQTLMDFLGSLKPD
jgi:pimeloyl-ACP methyl ester carboxylesterase